MKKLVCFVLCFAILALLGCGSAETAATNGETAPGGFMAGYAKVDITPEEPVPLAGYGNPHERISTGFKDPIYATCIAVQDAEGSLAVIMGIDTTDCQAGTYEAIRNSVADKYGISADHVVISASHMHSGPYLSSQDATIQRYIPVYSKLLIEVVDKAVEDLSPATMEHATVQTEGLNFVRRYQLSDGRYVGYESDVTESGLEILGHETEVDSSLQLLKFRREEKADILLANYQTHPHRGGSSSDTLITADLVGVFREEVKAALGCEVIYITGASGNVNPYSLVPEENITKNYKEQGKALAQYAIDAEGSYAVLQTGKVAATSMRFDGQIDRSEDHLAAAAAGAVAIWQQTRSVAEVRKQYLEQGINSPFHANVIIKRMELGTAQPFDIWALRVGDVGFAVAPYEMMDTQGMFIKENSPFSMTIITTCANASYGYIPSRLVREHGGYEADHSYYVTGSGEKLADMYVQMLTQIKN